MTDLAKDKFQGIWLTSCLLCGDAIIFLVRLDMNSVCTEFRGSWTNLILAV